jgi:hypothetical protein
MFTRAAVAAFAATALVASFPGAASAKTVYSEKASATKGSPKLDGHCNSVNRGRKVAGMACFKKKGDRVWIRDRRADGLRVEVRGVVNSKGQPGFRCYGNYKGGWRICDSFDRKMAEGHVFLWYVTLLKGKKVVATSGEKMSMTS